ncbi:MAG: K(+)-transporting ATPase subunit F [Verrucomicrobiota bacterium]
MNTTMETIITGVIALVLIGYLLVAMIHPEKF